MELEDNLYLDWSDINSLHPDMIYGDRERKEDIKNFKYMTDKLPLTIRKLITEEKTDKKIKVLVDDGEWSRNFIICPENGSLVYEFKKFDLKFKIVYQPNNPFYSVLKENESLVISIPNAQGDLFLLTKPLKSLRK